MKYLRTIADVVVSIDTDAGTVGVSGPEWTATDIDALGLELGSAGCVLDLDEYGEPVALASAVTYRLKVVAVEPLEVGPGCRCAVSEPPDARPTPPAPVFSIDHWRK